MRVLSIALMLCAVVACDSAHAQRSQIGHVHGVPVYSDQVQGASEQERAETLRILFMQPVISAYAKAHIEKFRITDAEASFLIERIQDYSHCSKNGYELPETAEQKRFVVNALGTGVKVQSHVYRNFGGGRLLFQQAGIEAFDATHKFLQQSEAEGMFAITDAALRNLAYDYWTRDHGAFLIEDPAAIEAALDLDTVISKCPST